MTTAPALVVGTCRWCMASLHRNSRTDERSTLRPVVGERGRDKGGGLEEEGERRARGEEGRMS